MKRFALLLMTTLTMAVSLAQSLGKTDVWGDVEPVKESLTDAPKDLRFLLTDEVMIAVDSILEEGRFMQALEQIDSVLVNWKKTTGREPSPLIYLKKGLILMNLEEWQDLVKTTEECFSTHKNEIGDRIAASIYEMQGIAHRYLKEYREAIRSYEDGLYFYTKTESLGNQGDMLCKMADCYGELGKHVMASSFYEKGLNKFLEYFGTSRSALLRSNFDVRDPRKKPLLSLFSIHLFNLAIHEQDYGSRINSKEYLLMSSHCGYTTAMSEFQRIYGYQ